MGRFRNYARVEQIEMDIMGMRLLVKATSPDSIISVDMESFCWQSDRALGNAIHDALAEHFAGVDAG